MWLGLAIDPYLLAQEIGYYPGDYCPITYNGNRIEYRFIQYNYNAYLIM